MKNPYLSLLKTAWIYARTDRKKYVLVYAMFIGATIIASLNPLLFGWFIGKAQNDTDRVLEFTLMYAGCYFLLKLLEWSLHGPARVMERTLAFHISRNFLQEKYHQILHVSPQWHQDHHSGATISRLQKGYDALRGFFDRGFMFLYTLTKFILSVAAILYFSPLFGSIAIALGLLNIGVISWFNKPYLKTLKEVHKKERLVSANLFDSLSNIRTVISLRLEKSMERGLLNKVRLVLFPFRRNALINEWKWFVADMLITLIYCVIVVGFVYQHYEPGKVFYIAGLVTLLGYVNQFTSVFQNVASQFTDISQYNAALKEVDVISDAYASRHRPGKSSDTVQHWKSIEIRNLDFIYPQQPGVQHVQHHLRQISIKIDKGKKIAFIGESGCGKSTLLTLLRGLYSPEPDYECRVDGVSRPLDDLHASVTLLPQEPEIFENTIAYNITMGVPYSKSEIMAACSMAHFTPIIEGLPNGLSTDIKEKGVNLSGGQKQRLALARGILAARNSNLVLLDEPTSSVDPKTESMIYDNFFQAFRDKAIVSSLHRLHLLEKFDYIYILDKGRIKDEGSFEDLMANSSVFQEMWAHQKMGTLASIRA
jgi:ABC-type multidrug transport system fused ATPase/permease subunit